MQSTSWGMSGIFTSRLFKFRAISYTYLAIHLLASGLEGIIVDSIYDVCYVSLHQGLVSTTHHARLFIMRMYAAFEAFDADVTIKNFGRLVVLPSIHDTGVQPVPSWMSLKPRCGHGASTILNNLWVSILMIPARLQPVEIAICKKAGIDV